MDPWLISFWLYIIGVFSVCHSLLFSYGKSFFWGTIMFCTAGIISDCNVAGEVFAWKQFFVQTTLLLSLMFFGKAFTDYFCTDEGEVSDTASRSFVTGVCFAIACLITFFVPFTPGKILITVFFLYAGLISIIWFGAAIIEFIEEIKQKLNTKKKQNGGTKPSEEFLLMFYSLQTYKYTVSLNNDLVKNTSCRVYKVVGKDIVIGIQEPDASNTGYRSVGVKPALIDLTDADREVLIQYFDTLLLTCNDLTIEENTDV